MERRGKRGGKEGEEWTQGIHNSMHHGRYLSSKEIAECGLKRQLKRESRSE